MKVRALLLTLAGFILITGGSSSAASLAYGNYYDETVSERCENAYLCQLNFSQTPTDRLVMIRKVNCQIHSTSPVEQGFLGIGTAYGGGGGIRRYLPLPIPSPVAGSSYQTNFESDSHWLVGQGRFPFIQMNSVPRGTYSILCTITGDLVAPIQ